MFIIYILVDNKKILFLYYIINYTALDKQQSTNIIVLEYHNVKIKIASLFFCITYDIGIEFYYLFYYVPGIKHVVGILWNVCHHLLKNV